MSARVTSWLLRTATMAGRWFEPGYGRPDRPDPDLAVLSSAEESDAWLRVNRDNWLGGMRSAASSGRHTLVLDCAESMHWFSERWTHGTHWHEVFALGADAAAALGDLAQQAAQLNYLAWVHSVPPSDPDVMLRHAAEAAELAGRSGATAQIAWAHSYTAWALRLLGRLDEAVVSASLAADTFKAIGDTDAYVQNLAQIGNSLRDKGRSAEALEWFRSALAVVEDENSGMTPSIATHSRPFALIRVGECLGHLGRRAEAIAVLSEGIDLLDTLQVSDFRFAGALEALAALLSEEGRDNESGRAYARAAQVFRAIGDAEAHGRCEELATAAR
ncbi:hypothetical protein [Streptomyces sp. NPDC088358]|uniref:hypothetical protein n=1 Tax=Streptomyces sp. NPDC088358 TaxID=3365857 RepID=UPI00382019AA